MSGSSVVGLQEKLDEFLRSMPMEVLVGRLASRCGMTAEEAGTFLELYANEMRTTLGLVGEKIEPGLKMLEIGAGLCLFSVFLKKQGYDITALEPSAGGFGKFETAKGIILEAYAAVGLRVWEFPAQDLLSCDDRFDLIFSNNVLEHIPDLEVAWSGMCGVLKPEGVMLHNCPNYFFPYEPHLGIPVFKFAPQLSTFFFRGVVERHRDVWESLNFITYFDVKRLTKAAGMKVVFKKGLLFEALSRIEKDPFFRERHSGSLVMAVYTILNKTSLLGLLRHIPPMLSTPMIFQCGRSDQWPN